MFDPELSSQVGLPAAIIAAAGAQIGLATSIVAAQGNLLTAVQAVHQQPW